MAAIDPNLLLAETKCYACAGMTIPELLELGLLRRQLLAAVPTADVSLGGLVAYALCYACYGANTYQLVQLALLDQIAQAP